MDADQKAKELRQAIRKTRKEEKTKATGRKLRSLYRELDALQFQTDYLCLIIDKKKDYYRACKGFAINGIHYKRLLGTNGGIKNSTIVFVSERYAEELSRRIDNDRNTSMPLVTAKLEAYKALACSASTPLSMPKGVLVIQDCETTFPADYLYLTDEGEGEPLLEQRKGEDVTLNASDGYGLMSPTLAQRWSEELGLDYITSGINTRFAFEKGMVVPFDFLAFAQEYAPSFMVTDAWGDTVDLREIELILTTSMVKLWDSYQSCADYLEKSVKNGYTFAATKCCPKELEEERRTNYQFLQSYHLTEDELEELLAPTVAELKEILSLDPQKAILFVKGKNLTENNIEKQDDDFAKAMMAEPQVLNDPYVQRYLYGMIRERINEAKVGVLKVHGNYSIVIGDPVALCQHMLGLTVTGLLQSGEIYNQYWAAQSTEAVIAMRAPMTCHNNILKRTIHQSEMASHWYQHIQTVTILNAWDLSCAALNGCDFDGDIVFLTDNPVLLKKTRETLPLLCQQRKATKTIATEEDFIRSNLESFGNDIGKTTNWITSMFERQSYFERDSEEYKVLEYRIQCGQL